MNRPDSRSSRRLLMAPLVAVLVAVLVLVAVAACTGSGPDADGMEGDSATGAAGEATSNTGSSPPGPGSSVGQPAPEYTATTLDGDPVALSELRGEAVLLNVWATWCAPCRQEIPELQALHEEHADQGLRVVGVTVDSRSAGEAVRRFMDEYGMTYHVWWDPDQRALSTFGGVGVPITILVDRDGTVAWEHLGALERNDPGLRAALEETLRTETSGAS